MHLSAQVRCRNWGGCDVGKRAGVVDYNYAMIFPQDILAGPPQVQNRQGLTMESLGTVVASYEQWRWSVMLNMGKGRSGGGFKRWSVCHDHSEIMRLHWENIFRAEVEEIERYHAYMDRIER